jgi:hypothetical protein
MINLKRVFIPVILLLAMVGFASAVEYQELIVSGSVITKPLLGLLISLHIEDYVSQVDAVYIYNLISVSVILFIAAMSGPRSEAAFCIVVPIFAGIFEWFGWLRATDAATHMPSNTAQLGLMALTVVMGLFGVFLYMNDQNRQNYGTAGPGGKWMNIAIFIALFSVAGNFISGVAIFPSDHATQPFLGQCVAGVQCDTYGNIDMNKSVDSARGVSGANTDAVSVVAMLGNLAIGLVMMIVTIAVGMLALPLILNNIMVGIFPWLFGNTTLGLFIVLMEPVILYIYYLGALDLFYKPMPGTTL